jgi:hypothetical protein
MKTPLVSICVAVAATVAASVDAQGGARGDATSASPIVLIDSTGRIAARPFSDTIVLVTDRATGIVAPAAIGPAHGDDQRAASGWATWRAAGSVLYTSDDCTTGAYVFGSGVAGLRATSQVQTPAGIVLHVGAIGPARTVGVRSILYDSGCSTVTVRQNGLFPVDMTINLTVTYPPPLSYR